MGVQVPGSAEDGMMLLGDGIVGTNRTAETETAETVERGSTWSTTPHLLATPAWKLPRHQSETPEQAGSLADEAMQVHQEDDLSSGDPLDENKQ